MAFGKGGVGDITSTFKDWSTKLDASHWDIWIKFFLRPDDIWYLADIKHFHSRQITTSDDNWIFQFIAQKSSLNSILSVNICTAVGMGWQHYWHFPGNAHLPTSREVCSKSCGLSFFILGSRDLSSSTEIRFCPGHGKKGSNYLKSPLIWYVFLCTSQASLTVRIIFPRYEIENGLSEGVFLCTQNAFAALWVWFWSQYLIKMHSLTPTPINDMLLSI